MRTVEGSQKSLTFLLEKYGFLFVLLFCLGVFQPDLSSKSGLMELDFDKMLSDKSGGSLKKQLFWIGFFIFFVIRFFFVKSLFSKSVLNKLYILSLFPIIALASSFWAEYSSFVIKRSFFQLCFIVTVFLSFYYCCRREGLYNSIYMAVVIVFLMSVLTILMGTGFSASGAFSSYLSGKNLFAINLIVLVALVVFLIKRYGVRKELVFMLIGLVALLVLSRSKTNIIILCFFFSLFFISFYVSKIIIYVLLFIILMVFVLVPFGSTSFGIDWNPGMSMDPGALTGRGFIWETLYFDIKAFDKSFYGYGYGGYFNTGVVPFYFDDDFSFIKRITSAHNGYLELILQFGFFISFLIFVVYIFLLKEMKESWQSASLIIPVVNNVTESSFFRDQNLIWLFCIVLIVTTCLRFDKDNNKFY